MMNQEMKYQLTADHRLIRRAETPRDYFATLDFLPLMKPLFED